MAVSYTPASHQLGFSSSSVSGSPLPSTTQSQLLTPLRRVFLPCRVCMASARLSIPRDLFNQGSWETELPSVSTSYAAETDWWRRKTGNHTSACYAACQAFATDNGAPKSLFSTQETPGLKEYAFRETATSRGHKAGVPVYVMLPLDSINPCNNTVNRRRAMDASLLALKSAGVEGIMVDVWWGIVEKDGPGRYNWDGYKDLLSMVKRHGLKVQAVMSFHQCGGNVGDSCL